MNSSLTAYKGASIFDGQELLDQHALLVAGDQIQGIVRVKDVPTDAIPIMLEGGTLAPGYVDLQVNGGGGVMFNDDQSVETLRRIASAHATLGATSILPTLITDIRECTIAAIDAVDRAVAAGISGITGLHLEGPHLAPSRKGAHDANLIRPMDEQDLEILLDAATRLPTLMLTIAPEGVTRQQVNALSGAGVIVSLGHTDADFQTCSDFAEAGATCVTHLFNAMSQLENREPGVVGAALSLPGLSAGLIADGIHVHPKMISLALKAKTGPGDIFLVSDSMAAAGSDIKHFNLNGRRIIRENGRLTLQNGTLAGADLDLTTAIRVLVNHTSCDLIDAIRMATSVPAKVIGRSQSIGRLARNYRADFIHITAGAELTGVWQGGAAIDC